MGIFEIIVNASHRSSISVFEFATAHKTSAHVKARVIVCQTLYYRKRMEQDKIARIIQRTQQNVSHAVSKDLVV
jgi:hypothetical protein